jgi:hypothetical protein
MAVLRNKTKEAQASSYGNWSLRVRGIKDEHCIAQTKGHSAQSYMFWVLGDPLNYGFMLLVVVSSQLGSII